MFPYCLIPDICSNADQKTDVLGLLKILYYSNFAESLQVFISADFAAAPGEEKSRMEQFYR